LTNALAGLAPPAAQPREYSVIKIEPFYGRDGEDPIEWLETFDRASITNRWTTQDRKVQVASGHLKDAAAAWFATNSAAMGNNWNTTTNGGNNFTDLFKAHFASDARKNIWYQQLMNLRQLSNENVDSYATKFIKLANKVGLTDAAQQKRMFLFGLSPTLTPMVHMQNPADVAAAVVAARNAEIGFNYAATTTAIPTLPSSSTSTISSLV
jgi:hypothetical protein